MPTGSQKEVCTPLKDADVGTNGLLRLPGQADRAAHGGPSSVGSSQRAGPMTR